MRKIKSVAKIRRDLGIPKKIHQNILTKQIGYKLKPSEYIKFRKKPHVYVHPVHRDLYVCAENLNIEIVDALTTTKLKIYECDEYYYVFYRNQTMKIHNIIAEAVAGRVKLKSESVHHIDFNRKNNQRDNLVILDNTEHRNIHQKNSTYKSLQIMRHEHIKDVRG